MQAPPANITDGATLRPTLLSSFAAAKVSGTLNLAAYSAPAATAAPVNSEITATRIDLPSAGINMSPRPSRLGRPPQTRSTMVPTVTGTPTASGGTPGGSGASTPVGSWNLNPQFVTVPTAAHQPQSQRHSSNQPPSPSPPRDPFARLDVPSPSRLVSSNLPSDANCPPSAGQSSSINFSGVNRFKGYQLSPLRLQNPDSQRNTSFFPPKSQPHGQQLQLLTSLVQQQIQQPQKASNRSVSSSHLTTSNSETAQSLPIIQPQRRHSMEQRVQIGLQIPSPEMLSSRSHQLQSQTSEQCNNTHEPQQRLYLDHPNMFAAPYFSQLPPPVPYTTPSSNTANTSFTPPTQFSGSIGPSGYSRSLQGNSVPLVTQSGGGQNVASATFDRKGDEGIFKQNHDTPVVCTPIKTSSKLSGGGPVKPPPNCCEVCWDGIEGPGPRHALICCVGCKILVHRSCYGILEPDTSSWKCSLCKYWLLRGYDVPTQQKAPRPISLHTDKVPLDSSSSLSASPRRQHIKKFPSLQCAMCLRQDGAMCVGPEGVWVHVSCVMFTGEGPHFMIPSLSQKPVNIRRFINLHDRKAFKCSICLNGYGYTQRCGFPGCQQRVHISCAFSKGIRPKAEIVNMSRQRGGGRLIKIVVCRLHNSAESRMQTSQHQAQLIEQAEAMGWDLVSAKRKHHRRDRASPTGISPRKVDAKRGLLPTAIREEDEPKRRWGTPTAPVRQDSRESDGGRDHKDTRTPKARSLDSIKEVAKIQQVKGQADLHRKLPPGALGGSAFSKKVKNRLIQKHNKPEPRAALKGLYHSSVPSGQQGKAVSSPWDDDGKRRPYPDYNRYKSSQSRSGDAAGKLVPTSSPLHTTDRPKDKVSIASDDDDLEVCFEDLDDDDGSVTSTSYVRGAYVSGGSGTGSRVHQRAKPDGIRVSLAHHTRDGPVIGRASARQRDSRGRPRRRGRAFSNSFGSNDDSSDDKGSAVHLDISAHTIQKGVRLKWSRYEIFFKRPNFLRPKKVLRDSSINPSSPKTGRMASLGEVVDEYLMRTNQYVEPDVSQLAPFLLLDNTPTLSALAISQIPETEKDLLVSKLTQSIWNPHLRALSENDKAVVSSPLSALLVFTSGDSQVLPSSSARPQLPRDSSAPSLVNCFGGAVWAVWSQAEDNTNAFIDSIESLSNFAKRSQLSDVWSSQEFQKLSSELVEGSIDFDSVLALALLWSSDQFEHVQNSFGVFKANPSPLFKNLRPLSSETLWNATCLIRELVKVRQLDFFPLSAYQLNCIARGLINHSSLAPSGVTLPLVANREEKREVVAEVSGADPRNAESNNKQKLMPVDGDQSSREPRKSSDSQLFSSWIGLFDTQRLLFPALCPGAAVVAQALPSAAQGLRSQVMTQISNSSAQTQLQGMINSCDANSAQSWFERSYELNPPIQCSISFSNLANNVDTKESVIGPNLSKVGASFFLENHSPSCPVDVASLESNKSKKKFVLLGNALWDAEAPVTLCDKKIVRQLTSDGRISRFALPEAQLEASTECQTFRDDFVGRQCAFYLSLENSLTKKILEIKKLYASTIEAEEELPPRLFDSSAVMQSVNSAYVASHRWNRLISHLVWGLSDQPDQEYLLFPATPSTKGNVKNKRQSPPVVEMEGEAAPGGRFGRPMIPITDNLRQMNAPDVSKSLIRPYLTSAQLTVPLPPFAVGSGRSRSCCVCFGAEWDSVNAIISCMVCHCSVHKGCYGVTDSTIDAETENWLCQRCEFEKKRASSVAAFQAGSIRCELCNTLGGALKRTIDDHWVHLTCVFMLLPEVVPTQIQLMEGWNLSGLQRWRFEHDCSVCAVKYDNSGECDSSQEYHLDCYPLRLSEAPPHLPICQFVTSRRGICLKCSYPGCKKMFHPMCAWLSGMYFSVIKKVDKFSTWIKSADSIFFPVIESYVLCFDHSPMSHVPGSVLDHMAPQYRSSAYQRCLRHRRYINRDLYPHLCGVALKGTVRSADSLSPTLIPGGLGGTPFSSAYAADADAQALTRDLSGKPLTASPPPLAQSAAAASSNFGRSPNAPDVLKVDTTMGLDTNYITQAAAKSEKNWVQGSFSDVDDGKPEVLKDFSTKVEEKNRSGWLIDEIFLPPVESFDVEPIDATEPNSVYLIGKQTVNDRRFSLSANPATLLKLTFPKPHELVPFPDKYCDQACAVCFCHSDPLNAPRPFKMETEELQSILRNIDHACNGLIKCHRCGLSVHRSCYGTSYPTESQLRLALHSNPSTTNEALTKLLGSDNSSDDESQKCSQESSNRFNAQGKETNESTIFSCEVCSSCHLIDDITCLLCSRRGGALKALRLKLNWTPLSDDQDLEDFEDLTTHDKQATAVVYAHMTCLIFCPGVLVGSSDMLQPVKGLERVIRSRLYGANRCCICHSCRGVALPCSQPGCSRFFHPLCAQLEGCVIEQRVDGPDKMSIVCYCQEHSADLALTCEPLAVLEQLRVLLEKLNELPTLKQNSFQARVVLHESQSRISSKLNEATKFVDYLQLNRPLVSPLDARYGCSIRSRIMDSATSAMGIPYILSTVEGKTPSLNQIRASLDVKPLSKIIESTVLGKKRFSGAEASKQAISLLNVDQKSKLPCLQTKRIKLKRRSQSNVPSEMVLSNLPASRKLDALLPKEQIQPDLNAVKTRSPPTDIPIEPLTIEAGDLWKDALASHSPEASVAEAICVTTAASEAISGVWSNPSILPPSPSSKDCCSGSSMHFEDISQLPQLSDLSIEEIMSNSQRRDLSVAEIIDLARQLYPEYCKRRRGRPSVKEKLIRCIAVGASEHFVSTTMAVDPKNLVNHLDGGSKSSTPRASNGSSDIMTEGDPSSNTSLLLFASHSPFWKEATAIAEQFGGRNIQSILCSTSPNSLYYPTPTKTTTNETPPTSLSPVRVQPNDNDDDFIDFRLTKRTKRKESLEEINPMSSAGLSKSGSESNFIPDEIRKQPLMIWSSPSPVSQEACKSVTTTEDNFVLDTVDPLDEIIVFNGKNKRRRLSELSDEYILQTNNTTLNNRDDELPSDGPHIIKHLDDHDELLGEVCLNDLARTSASSDVVDDDHSLTRKDEGQMKASKKGSRLRRKRQFECDSETDDSKLDGGNSSSSSSSTVEQNEEKLGVSSNVDGDNNTNAEKDSDDNVIHTQPNGGKRKGSETLEGYITPLTPINSPVEEPVLETDPSIASRRPRRKCTTKSESNTPKSSTPIIERSSSHDETTVTKLVYRAAPRQHSAASSMASLVSPISHPILSPLQKHSDSNRKANRRLNEACKALNSSPPPEPSRPSTRKTLQLSVKSNFKGKASRRAPDSGVVNLSENLKDLPVKDSVGPSKVDFESEELKERSSDDKLPSNCIGPPLDPQLSADPKKYVSSIDLLARLCEAPHQRKHRPVWQRYLADVQHLTQCVSSRQHATQIAGGSGPKVYARATVPFSTRQSNPMMTDDSVPNNNTILSSVRTVPSFGSEHLDNTETLKLIEISRLFTSSPTTALSLSGDKALVPAAYNRQLEVSVRVLRALNHLRLAMNEFEIPLIACLWVCPRNRLLFSQIYNRAINLGVGAVEYLYSDFVNKLVKPTSENLSRLIVLDSEMKSPSCQTLWQHFSTLVSPTWRAKKAASKNVPRSRVVATKGSKAVALKADNATCFDTSTTETTDNNKKAKEEGIPNQHEVDNLFQSMKGTISRILEQTSTTVVDSEQLEAIHQWSTRSVDWNGDLRFECLAVGQKIRLYDFDNYRWQEGLVVFFDTVWQGEKATFESIISSSCLPKCTAISTTGLLLDQFETTLKSSSKIIEGRYLIYFKSAEEDEFFAWKDIRLSEVVQFRSQNPYHLNELLQLDAKYRLRSLLLLVPAFHRTSSTERAFQFPLRCMACKKLLSFGNNEQDSFLLCRNSKRQVSLVPSSIISEPSNTPQITATRVHANGQKDESSIWLFNDESSKKALSKLRIRACVNCYCRECIESRVVEGDNGKARKLQTWELTSINPNWKCDDCNDAPSDLRLGTLAQYTTSVTVVDSVPDDDVSQRNGQLWTHNTTEHGDALKNCKKRKISTVNEEQKNTSRKRHKK